MNNLSNSLKLITSPSIEYELHVGASKDGKYTPYVSKEAYDKLMNHKSLFSVNKNATTTSTSFITQYKNTRLVQMLDSKYKETEHYFENKKRIKTSPVLGTNIRVVVAQEEKVNVKNKTSLGKQSHTRLRKRTSKISKDNLWRFDMTEVYYDTANVNKLNNKSLKDPLYSVEVEYIHPLSNNTKNNKNALSSLKSIIETITAEIPETKLSVEEGVMQSIIQLFSPESRYNRIHIKGKTLETISMPSLMNQVIPVELKTLPCIKRGYAVTEKADGMRYFIFIDKEGHVYQIEKSKQITLLEIKLTSKQSSIYNTLIDVEYIDDINVNNNNTSVSNTKNAKNAGNVNNASNTKNTNSVSNTRNTKNAGNVNNAINSGNKKGGNSKKTGLYLIIDVLIHAGVDITTHKLADRVDKMNEVAKLLPTNWKPKKYEFPSDTETIHTLAKKVFTKKYKYNLDGLILTPDGTGCANPPHCKADFHKDNVQGGYFGKIFKWKPAKMNTIDFLVRQIKVGVFYLFISMSIGQYKRLLRQNKSNYALDDDYKKLFPDEYKAVNESVNKNKREQLFFPYYFKTRKYPELYKVSGSVSTKSIKLSDMDNKVVEFECITDKVNTLEGWKPERERTDKTAGNGYNTSVNTLDLIFNPITEDMLFNPKEGNGNAYYKNENRAKSKILNLRSFHNFVKDSLYRKYISTGANVIEIGGGRGGDMWKLKKQGVKSLLLTNISANGLKVAQNRYNSNKKKTTDRMTLETLAGNFGTNMTNAMKNKLKAVEEVDVISVQFAFHYFLESKKTLDNIFKNIDTFLKKGGVFIFTTFDGEIVNERLKKEGKLQVFRNGEKVIDIMKVYNGNKLNNHGQAIDVWYESFVEHAREYLVNYKFVLSYFEKNGYVVVESENFMNKLPDYKGHLDETDKEITGLHRYNVLRKL